MIIVMSNEPGLHTVKNCITMGKHISTHKTCSPRTYPIITCIVSSSLYSPVLLYHIGSDGILHLKATFRDHHDDSYPLSRHDLTTASALSDIPDVSQSSNQSRASTQFCCPLGNDFG